MADVKLKQVRSANGTSPKQRETLRSLKLGRIGRTSEMADTPQLRGMLDKVAHLVDIDGETTRGTQASLAAKAAPGAPG